MHSWLPTWVRPPAVHTCLYVRIRETSLVPSESVLDWHCASTAHKLFILLEISGALLMVSVKSFQQPGLDPVNLLSLCFGYFSPLVQWNWSICNATKVLKSPRRRSWILCDSSGAHHPLSLVPKLVERKLTSRDGFLFGWLPNEEPGVFQGNDKGVVKDKSGHRKRIGQTLFGTGTGCAKDDCQILPRCK